MVDLKVHDEQDDELIDGGFATVNEAAKYLRMGRSWLYSQMDCGRLVYSRFGRSRRIPWAAVKRLARQSLVGQQEA